jgi:hypothetical protein
MGDGDGVIRRTIALCVAAPLLACTAFHLPDLPPVSPASELAAPLGPAFITRASLPGELDQPQADEFLARLRDDLIATKLFESVEIGEAATANAVVVRPEFAADCFAEPMFTVLTLGAIPYPGCYGFGRRLSLSGRGFSREVVVDDRARPAMVIGWVAWPIALLPDWSLSPAERESESLRLSILGAVAERPEAVSGRDHRIVRATRPR